MYKIGDIAKLLGVSVDTLRLYDKKGIVSPVRMENGYRYYSRNQIIILNYVMMLKRANLPLETIKMFVHETDLDKSISELKDTESYIDEQIKKLQNIKKVVKKYIEVFEESKDEDRGIEIIDNTNIVYVNVDDIKNFMNPSDFSDKFGKYRFVFSLYDSIKSFSRRLIAREESEIINNLKFSYTCILEDEENFDDFSKSVYKLYPVKKFARFIIKCIIPDDYSDFARKYQQLIKMNYKVIGEILIRPASIRNGEEANIDYYEVFIPLK